MGVFFEEFFDYFEFIIFLFEFFLIIGDFNIYVNVVGDFYRLKFFELLEIMGL